MTDVDADSDDTATTDDLPATAVPRRRPTAEALSRLRRPFQRRRGTALFVVAAALLASIVLAGVLAPWLSPHDPNETALLNGMAPPALIGGEWVHPLGTDQLGRDILSRCLYGVRTSVGIALVGLVCSASLGIMIGLLAGLGGRWADRGAMVAVDVFIALPNLLLVLAGIALLGTDIWVLVAMIALVRWETYARLVRGQMLHLRELGFVEASRALGAGPLKIAWRHALPNLASPLMVLVTLNFPGVLLMEASLSFLGVGVQPPTASLGRMVGDGRDHLVNAWWLSVMPALVIVAITLLMQLIGDGLRDRVDVRGDR